MANDLISRQAAISEIVGMTTMGVEELFIAGDKEKYDWIKGLSDSLVKIINLPSAEPELDEWCTDCKEYDQERHCCPRWNRVIRQTLKDAQPERKKGKWDTALRDDPLIKTSVCICSICGGTAFGTPDFCPNCGAEMRGEQDE